MATLANGSWDRVALVDKVTADLSESERPQLFRVTARAFYRLWPHSIADLPGHDAGASETQTFEPRVLARGVRR